MYVVTGATGNTGTIVAEKLLGQGEQVRVIGRSLKRLERFAKRGADAFLSDMTDRGALTKAFSGAKAAYVMIPPDMTAADYRAHQGRVTDALVLATQSSGLKHVVVLSSFGADKPDKTGPVVGLYHLEQAFRRIPGVNALFLRAGYFMENLLPQCGVIKSLGYMAGPVRDDLPLPMIATPDIGARAAEALLKLDFEGKQAQELQGAGDVSYAQAANMVGAAIGKPDLRYHPAPAAQLKPALVGMGMSANVADLLLQMAEALNSGYMKMLEPRSTTSTTPTTLETFLAEVFVPVYRGQAAGSAGS